MKSKMKKSILTEEIMKIEPTVNNNNSSELPLLSWNPMCRLRSDDEQNVFWQ